MSIGVTEDISVCKLTCVVVFSLVFVETAVVMSHVNALLL